MQQGVNHMSLANSTVVRLKDFHAGEIGNKVSSKVSHAVNSLAGQLVGVAKNTDGFVRSNPWRAIGAVALAGLAAGVVTSVGARRLRRRAADRVADGRHRDSMASEVSGG
jgi:ElaB/YqjD/DUF883 family membrane-anchored ribosome-binding protein